MLRSDPQEVMRDQTAFQFDAILHPTPVFAGRHRWSCWIGSLASRLASAHGRACAKGRAEWTDDLGYSRHYCPNLV
jgi:hypothetical protein